MKNESLNVNLPFRLESKSAKYMDGWSEENWEEEMEQHPFFNKSINPGAELPPLLQVGNLDDVILLAVNNFIIFREFKI